MFVVVVLFFYLFTCLHPFSFLWCSAAQLFSLASQLVYFGGAAEAEAATLVMYRLLPHHNANVTLQQQQQQQHLTVHLLALI